MKEFIENSRIKLITEEAEKLKKSEKIFSDVTDGAGNQYVDLVQEGGGVLGVALVGYTYVLEKSGIRFFSLAGTSAGAINTMLMAALGELSEHKSEKILRILNDKNLFDLVDGPEFVKKIIRKFLREDKGIGWIILRNIRTIYRIITNKLGLNPGQDFINWIDKELEDTGIKTMDDVMEIRKKIPAGLKHRGGLDVSDLQPLLSIIAADITTHSKIEFPAMSELYFDNSEAVKPSSLVRTSMSIPLFFEPVKFGPLPNRGVKNDPKWIKHCKYYGPVPNEASFVDGGLLSNFPINVFHRKDGGVPRKPTFGVRLSTYRKDFSEIKGIKSMMGSMISSMRQIYDYDFLRRNPDYSRLICHIDADKEFNWLDFELPKEEQVDMFILGAEKALEFLKEFDWEEYKGVRKKTALPEGR